MKIPAKTFFLGEYLALFGGPACLALTEPCFGLDPKQRLHPDSPAQQLWRAQTDQFCDWGIDDPYQGKGGLGASGAEFLFAYQQLFPKLNDPNHLHQTYLRYAEQGSGYDVLAQSQEGMVVVSTQPLELAAKVWPFNEFGFILVHTGIKLTTHTHLQNLGHMSWQTLCRPVDLGCESLLVADSEQFLASIHDVYLALQALNLVAKHSQAMIDDWRQRWPILAAKGCGALGSDVVALFVKNEYIEQICCDIAAGGWLILATQADLYFKDANTQKKSVKTLDFFEH